MFSNCRGTLLLLVLCALARVASAQAINAFTQTYVESNGGIASRMIEADVVGSAAPDLIFAVQNLSVVRIGATQANQTHTYTSVNVATGPIDVAAGDLDGDGDLDLVTINAAQVTTLVNGGGGFVRTDYAAANLAATRVQLVDFDGDGDLDIARGSVVRLNNGPATFPTTVTPVTVGGSPIDAIFGDVDGDGDVDCVGRSFVGGTYALGNFINVGGVFTWNPASLRTFTGVLANSTPQSAMADMNGDLIEDVVLHVASGVTPVQSGMVVCFGQPNGTFNVGPACGQWLRPLLVTGEPVIADLDGDGDADVMANETVQVAPQQVGTSPWFWRNDGMGTLYAPESMNGIIAPSAGCGPVMADDDLDGDTDIAVATVNGGATDARGYANGGLTTGPTALTLVKVSGDNQVVSTAQTFPPLVVRVQDQNGVPVSGVSVTFTVTSGAASVLNTSGVIGPNECGSLSDANGNVSCIPSPNGTSGPISIVAQTPTAVPVTFTIASYALQLTIASGGVQSAIAGSLFPQVLSVLVTDQTGVVQPGVQVAFSATPGVVFDNGGSIRYATSNALGIASANTLYALPSASSSSPSIVATVTFGVNAAPPVTFTMTVFGTPTISVIAGEPQTVDFDDPLDAMTFSVTDDLGRPMQNFALTFTVAPLGAMSLNGPAAMATDSLGRVTISPSVLSPAQNQVTVTATSPLAAGPGIARVFVRKMTVIHTPSTPFFFLTYQHEHAGQPIILAADVPLPSPGVVMTPYGPVSTSILAPAPTLYVASTTGGLGVFDPTLIANPTYSTTRTVPPVLFGTVLVLQIYGFDPTYMPDVTKAVFVSNAVTVTL